MYAAEELRGYTDPGDQFPWELTEDDHRDLLQRLERATMALGDGIRGIAQASGDEYVQERLTDSYHRLVQASANVRLALSNFDGEPDDEPGEETENASQSAAMDVGDSHRAAPDALVELDGMSVPLADCDWVEWAPCGCPVGTSRAGSVTTEEDAWKNFYPREGDRERAQAQGYRWELMTHTRWSAEVADWMKAGCPHPGPAAETGTEMNPHRLLVGEPDFPNPPVARPPASRGQAAVVSSPAGEPRLGRSR